MFSELFVSLGLLKLQFWDFRKFRFYPTSRLLVSFWNCTGLATSAEILISLPVIGVFGSFLFAVFRILGTGYRNFDEKSSDLAAECGFSTAKSSTDLNRVSELLILLTIFELEIVFAVAAVNSQVSGICLVGLLLLYATFEILLVGK